jgi:hypothetical protein
MNQIAVICGMRAEAALVPRGVACACSGGRAARAFDEARRLLAEGAAGLLSFGIAGGLDPALKPGDLVLGTAVAVDEKLLICESSWVEALIVGLSPPPRPSPLEGEGAEKNASPIEGEGEKNMFPPPLRGRDRVGGISTGVVVGAADAVTYPLAKASLHKRWQALAVDLESGAVARACAEAGKPFAVLRAIADPASRSIPPTALLGITASGRMNPFAVARGVLAHPGDLPKLVKLGGEARAALAALAGATRRLGPALGLEPGMARGHD